MSKVKIRSIIILAVALLAAVVLGAVLGMPRGGVVSAARNYQPTAIFSQGTGGDVGVTEAETDETSYINFTFRDNGSVYFRRDLALKWFVSAKDPETESEGEAAGTAGEEGEGFADPGKAVYFSMAFAFAPAKVSTTEVSGTEMNVCPRCGTNFAKDATECTACGFTTADIIFFDRFEITFESAEENISKKAKATNSIVFLPDPENEGGLKVGIKNAELHAKDDEDDEEEENKNDPETFFSIAAENIGADMAISFSDLNCGPGEFAVTLTPGSGEAIALGNFTNIGGNFLEYRSSASSTPCTPITFHTELAEVTAPEGKTYSKVSQQVVMKELNGQTFEVEDGVVADNAPAVLVLNEAIYGFTLGQRFSLSPEYIDVCRDSVDQDRTYYMLRKEAGTENYHIPDLSETTDFGTLDLSTYFMPSEEGGASESQYVAIRYILRDGRKDTDAEYDYIYLSWYADPGFVETMSDAEGNKLDMIKVETNEQRGTDLGPFYFGITAEEDETNHVDETALNQAVTAYNTALTAVASDEKTSAGNGAYIYLPSFRGLIASNYADYRNLRFSISYKKEDSGSSPSTETSLRYNNLRFQINVEGHYAFKVIASDAAGNTMKYYLDKELVDVTTSNVWDIDEIPTFEFDISYKGADVTEPGELDPASRGTSYSFEDFDIVDLGDNIKEYTLYYFDDQKIPEGLESPSYSEFVDNAKKYAETDYKDCLVEIRTYNHDVSEDDEQAWDKTDNDHHWDPDSSLSFVPQKPGYYVLRMTYHDLHDTENGVPKSANYYEIVEVRNPYDYIPAKSDWLANNVTSVVLFSISAVLAVIIVILFIVKPSDKKVEEVDLGSLKGKKDKKNKK